MYLISPYWWYHQSHSDSSPQTCTTFHAQTSEFPLALNLNSSGFCLDRWTRPHSRIPAPNAQPFVAWRAPRWICSVADRVALCRWWGNICPAVEAADNCRTGCHSQTCWWTVHWCTVKLHDIPSARNCHCCTWNTCQPKSADTRDIDVRHRDICHWWSRWRAWLHARDCMPIELCSPLRCRLWWVWVESMHSILAIMCSQAVLCRYFCGWNANWNILFPPKNMLFNLRIKVNMTARHRHAIARNLQQKEAPRIGVDDIDKLEIRYNTVTW